RFIGRVSREKIWGVYDQADIYLTNPYVDNMPVSLLECFAAGLPVIATRVGGIPYILQHERTGLLVDCDDHREIANSAFRLLEEDGLAPRLVRNAREECRKYTPAAVASQWVQFYANLLTSDNPNAAEEIVDDQSPRTAGIG